MATGAPAAYRDPCFVRCRAELHGLITISLKADNRKPRASGGLSGAAGQVNAGAHAGT